MSNETQEIGTEAVVVVERVINEVVNETATANINTITTTSTTSSTTTASATDNNEKNFLSPDAYNEKNFLSPDAYNEKAGLSLNGRSDIDFAVVDALPSDLGKDDDDDQEAGEGKKKKKKKDEKETVPTVSFLQLYRFASGFDAALLVLGFIGATLNGAALPLMTIIFSEILDALSTYSAALLSDDKDRISNAADDLNDTVVKYVIYFVVLGGMVFVVSYFQMTCWMIAGENIAGIVRQRYYKALMRQDIGFFDEVTSGDVTTRIAADTAMFQEGISEKVGLALQFGVTFVTGFIIGFVRGWRLALVVCSVIPLLVVGAAGMGKSLQASTTKGQDAYAKAGSIAEQMISGIRTVVAFGGERHAVKRYVAELDHAYKSGKRKAFISGVGLGSIFFIMFSTYGLGFWYGSKLLLDGTQTVAEVINTFFALIIGAFSLGQVAPNFTAVTNGMGAAAKLYAVIDRTPPIDSQSDEGVKLKKGSVKGRIEFQSVNFYYPTRPDIPVIKNFNLVIEPGETVALVGSSGSGKSTIVALLERFYDPSGGAILLDGQNIKDISVKSLRSQMGMVGQEPVLFQTTIEKNVKYGGILGEKDPMMEEVIEACKKANAHEFIQEQPHKYETTVGEKGSLLSGGQKQRIAIARALIKDPPILLLDEATSALDTTSERLVQEALDKAATDRTTVVVAHRLSTIKDADKIVVMSKGEIVEIGRHDELVEKRGAYYGLVRAQELKTERTKNDDEDESSGSSTEGDTTVVTIDEKQNRQQMLRRMSTKATIKSTKTDEEIRAEDEAEKLKVKAPLGRVARLNFPERWIILGGLIGGIMQGAQMPLYAVIFTRIFDVFAKVETDPDEFTREANFWSGMFVVLAGVCLIGMTLSVAMFSWSGERLTRRLREKTFEAILHQDIAFFDEERNGTGVLTSRLAVDASKVEGLTGGLMGTIVQVATTLIFGLTLAFAHGWLLTLVIVASMPIAGIASMLQLKTLAGFSAKTRRAYEGSGQIVQQSVSNMRTIAALTREETFITMYREALKQPHRVAVRGFLLSSFGYAVSQGVLFFIWSLAFWYGTKLVVDGEYTVLKMMNVIFAVIFSAVALGQASNFAPNTAKAKVAAVSIFELIDRKPVIDINDTKDKERPAPVTGEMRVDNAKFNYPARPDIEVLRGFEMDVPAGKTVALVGGSGCGKSTIVALLLRFYDVNSGTVENERTPVTEWNLEYMRSFFAVVGQEPTLFDGTIGENIAFGKVGCSQEEIDAAAKSANIHNFISNLPKGYDTQVGEKGAQLSGGQKQRVAIARALIRSPKILLLDEATSALDSESEKVVQDALDRASKDRTTVTIAHRLSTIQNADLIYVVKKGVVVERGKHHDLIKLGGVYADLVKKQQLGLSDA